MDCYSCKHKGEVPGSTHSSCKFLRSNITDQSQVSLLEFRLSSHINMLEINGEPVLDLNPHGVKNGWCNWPLDFDPIWIEKCVFYNL